MRYAADHFWGKSSSGDYFLHITQMSVVADLASPVTDHLDHQSNMHSSERTTALRKR